MGLKICYDDSLIPADKILSTAENIMPEINRARSIISSGYGDRRAFINLPYDEEMLSGIKSLISDKLSLDPRFLIVVGIGGSNLGTIAVQEAVLGRFYNLLDPDIMVLYADTVDPDMMNSIITLIKKALKENKHILLNVVSKSGDTTETIANFRVLLSLLKRYNRKYGDFIVVTTDRDSVLWRVAVRRGLSLLEIPSKVVGRYSVLSPVGLFPLGMLGIKIEDLLMGARRMTERCLSMNLKENPAAITASIQYRHYLDGKNISDLFFFSCDLESLGKWCRQLTAESLGKEIDRNGRRVNAGITPTVSIGSTDLHSVAQLYLGGPYDKLITFIRVEDPRSSVFVPEADEYSSLVKGIDGRGLKEILDAILEGTKEAFK
ncbi:hypothetical protein DRO64_07605, partial [Candidatus Bathyarchaeota archaeon]